MLRTVLYAWTRGVGLRREGSPRHAPQGDVRDAAAEALHRRRPRARPRREDRDVRELVRRQGPEARSRVLREPRGRSTTTSTSTTSDRSAGRSDGRAGRTTSRAPSSATCSRRSWAGRSATRSLSQSSIYPGEGDWEFNIDGIYTATARSARSLHVPLSLGLPERLDRPTARPRSDRLDRAPRRRPEARAREISRRHRQALRRAGHPDGDQDERAFNASFLAVFSAILDALNIVSIIILVIMMLILGNTIAMGVRERTQRIRRAPRDRLRPRPHRDVHRRRGDRAARDPRRRARRRDRLPVHRARAWARWLEENMGTFFPYFRVAPKDAVARARCSAHSGLAASPRSHPGAPRVAARRSPRPCEGSGEGSDDPHSLQRPQPRVARRTTVATALGLALVVFVFASRADARRRHEEDARPLRAAPTSRSSFAKAPTRSSAAGSKTRQMNLVMARPACASDADGQPLGVGEVVVVAAMEKFGADGVSNVQIRGVPDDAMAFRPTSKIVDGRAPQPGQRRSHRRQAHPRPLQGPRPRPDVRAAKNRPVKSSASSRTSGSSYESEVWVDATRSARRSAARASSRRVRVRLESPDKFDGFKAASSSDKQLGFDGHARDGVLTRSNPRARRIFIGALGGIDRVLLLASAR